MEEKKALKEFLEWSACIIVAIILALLVKYYIGTPTIVQHSSMYPTLQENQRLWLNRWDRTIGKMPERGDIITFEAPSVNFLSEEIADLEYPIAIYDDEPEGIVNKFLYYVLEIGKTSYIKRVIALPGEHVEIKDGKVFINGEELEEDYLQDDVITDSSKGVLSDFIVPDNCVFVMGDNREQSADSRAFGCIPLEKIEGKVAFRFWPLSLFGSVD